MKAGVVGVGKVGAACALVIIAGSAWDAKPAAGQEQPSARKEMPPTVPFWHVWTDDKGVSHQKRCEMSAFKFQSISPGAAPSWIDRQRTPGAQVVVLVLPVGWVGEWHENPKPQWIIPLSGRWFVETRYEIEYGADPDLKAFAQQTLPKIQDHLQRALQLQKEIKVP